MDLGDDKGKENGKKGEEKKAEAGAAGDGGRKKVCRVHLLSLLHLRLTLLQPTLNNTSLDSINDFADNMAPQKGADDPWTTEDDKQLIDLKAEGKTWAQIAEITGRPKSALQHHWKDINPEKQNNQNNKSEEKKDNNGGGNDKNDANNDEAKPTKAEKKAAKNAAKAEAAAATKPVSAKAASAAKTPSAAKSDGQARFTLGEWRTLQEDDVFSFAELQCLSELMLRDERHMWLRLASAFYDKTGRRVHSEDIREKFESMGSMK